MSVLHRPVKNQFHAKSYFGLPLLAALLASATLTLVLGATFKDVVNHQPLTIADAQLSAWLHARASPLLTSVMLVATAFGSTIVATGISVVLGLYLLRRRNFFWFAALVSSVAGGALLNRLLKFVFQRPRPHFDDPILSLTGYSFPSGHTMLATVLYGVLAAYLVSRTESLGQRLLAVLVASILIGVVGFSRIYLGAHYLSDVLGAIAEGLAWLSVCLIAVYSFWNHRTTQHN